MVPLGEADAYPRVLSLHHGERVCIGPFLYEMRRDVPDHCYMGAIGDTNDAIFKYLGIKDKMQWCRDRGVRPVGMGVFPYFTDEGIVQVVNILKREVESFRKLGMKPHYKGWDGKVI